MEYLLLGGAFFSAAVLYASAGFGGGSSYLAILSLSDLAAGTIRPIALLCNLAVTGQGSVAFVRAGVTPWRRALPLILASVPAAFLGGQVQLPREQYLFLLGVLLLVAGLLMAFRVGPDKVRDDGVADRADAGAKAAGKAKKPLILINILLGAVVGFVSGVVGIGGGIFLSPVLFLTRWDTARAIAATTSLFIALNSLAGLAGQLSVGLTLDLFLTGCLLLAVIAGGYLGTRLTLRRFSPATIRKVAALLILLVGARLIWANWPI